MRVTVDEELDQEDRVVDPARVEEVDRGSRPGRDRQEEGGQEDHGPEGAGHRGAVCHRARAQRRRVPEVHASTFTDGTTFSVREQPRRGARLAERGRPAPAKEQTP